MKRLVKRARAAVEPGFVWEDPGAGHLVACGDAGDAGFLAYLLERAAGDLEGASFDLVLADPPYQLASDNVIGLAGRKDMFFKEKWDRLDDAKMEELLLRSTSAAARVGARANVWFWISDWWLSDVKRALRSLTLRVWPTYVWCKSNPPHSIRKRCVASACEFLVMASAPGNYFNLDALPKQRSWFVAASDGEFHPAVCPWWVERPVVHAAERLRRRGESEYLNRAQKPLDATEALVRAGSPEGGLVLDLFGGTGTGLVAADRAGRRAVYVDEDPTQVREAARRLLQDRRDRG
jgi:DNA modification methylase